MSANRLLRMNKRIFGFVDNEILVGVVNSDT